VSRDGDRGYALVAAIAAVAAFACIALQVLAADRGAVATVLARETRARLGAAADAGVMIAIHGLATDDAADRWSIDGRVRHVAFEGVDLTIAIDDERGKAPLAGLDDEQARTLFEGAGASGGRLDALVDEFRARRARAPFRTIGDLMALPDMDAALLARVAPAVTTFFERNGPFDSTNASPLAISTMRALGGKPEALAAQSQFANERPDEQIAIDDNLVGRTLTVAVSARDRRGDRGHRTAIVELTGSRNDPFWIRYVE